MAESHSITHTFCACEMISSIATHQQQRSKNPTILVASHLKGDLFCGKNEGIRCFVCQKVDRVRRKAETAVTHGGTTVGNRQTAGGRG